MSVIKLSPDIRSIMRHSTPNFAFITVLKAPLIQPMTINELKLRLLWSDKDWDKHLRREKDSLQSNKYTCLYTDLDCVLINVA